MKPVQQATGPASPRCEALQRIVWTLVSRGWTHKVLLQLHSATVQEADEDDDDEGAAAAASDEWIDRVAAIARGAPSETLPAVAAAIRDFRQRLQSCAASGKAIAVRLHVCSQPQALSAAVSILTGSE